MNLFLTKIPSARPFFLLLLLARPALAQVSLLQELKPIPFVERTVGYSVAIDGNLMVAGTRFENAAYVYQRTGTTWSQVALLEPGTGDREDFNEFGSAVAISGTTIIVGARGNALDENLQNPLQYAGAAYVFEKSGSTWVQTQKLVAPTRIEYDVFGSALALSGSTLAVSAPSHDNLRGAVFMFDKIGTSWVYSQKLQATGGNTYLGVSLALAGNYLAVRNLNNTDVNEANPLDQAGSVIVFEKTGTTWAQVQKLVAADRTISQSFGGALALQGSTLVIGANGDFGGKGAAYVFERGAMAWTQTQKLVPFDRATQGNYTYFGSAVAVEGNRIVVSGARNSNDAAGVPLQPQRLAGGLYVYDKGMSSWAQTQKVVWEDPELNSDDRNNLAISGNTVVRGSPFNGTIGSVNRGSGVVFLFSNCPQLTFGFKSSGARSSSIGSNSEGLVTLQANLCAGGSVTFSDFSRSSNRIGFLEKIRAGTVNVRFNGNPVSVPRAQTDIKPADVSAYFAAAYGPYTLSSGNQGTLTQVFTPYFDANNDGDYDEGTDCLGVPIEVQYTINDPVITGLASSYCQFDDPVTLTALPANSGTDFGGPGVTGNVFSPSAAGVGGPYSITYTDQFGCAAPPKQVSVVGPGVVEAPKVAANTVVCANQALPFTFNGCFGPGTVFTVELSKPNGDFPGTDLDTVSGTGTLSLQIPSQTASGTNYRIRIKSSNPAITTQPSEAFRINALDFNSTPTVSLTAVCVGNVAKVSFTVQGNCSFLPGNVFRAELSNASGIFSNAVTLGAVRPGLNNVTIPENTPAGGGYRIRIRATAPDRTSSPSAAFTINVPAFTSTPTVSLDNRCAGEAVRLSFAVGCTFFSGNTFTAQLSDKVGSFASPVNLGNVTPGALNNVLIPAATLAGTGYKIRVLSSNPAVTSAASANFKVKACNGREIAPEAEGFQVLVSPNPAPEGRLRIAVTGAEGQPLRVDLFNGLGQPIRQQTVERAGETETLDWDISRQPQGLYLLRVSGATEAKTLKVLH